MKLAAYSSLTAFMAHWRGLRSLASSGREQLVWLAEMESIIGELARNERESLQGDGAAGEDARRRQRAERHLTQILRSRHVLSG